MKPEQKQIVARVEELLRWGDTLEAQLHQTRTLGVLAPPRRMRPRYEKS